MQKYDKIHIAAKAYGSPIGFEITGGEVHECKIASEFRRKDERSYIRNHAAYVLSKIGQTLNLAINVLFENFKKQLLINVTSEKLLATATNNFIISKHFKLAVTSIFQDDKLAPYPQKSLRPLGIFREIEQRIPDKNP